MIIKDVIKDMTTMADGESYCFMRILTIIGAAACVGFAAYALFRGLEMKINDWALAYSTITGGGAAGIWAKSKAEPEHD